MRLVRVELTRFFSRRAVVLLLVATALIGAFLAGTTIWNTRPVTAQELATAQAQAKEQATEQDTATEIATCRLDPEQYFGPGSVADDCAQLAPTVEAFLGRSPLSLGDELTQAGLGLPVLVAVLMLLCGATFAGADWATGSMSNQVLFVPRRLRVWTAKGVAVTLGSLLAAAVVVVGFWLALYVVAEQRGRPTSAAVLHDVALQAGRGVLLAALAGLGGYALAMLLRSTVATVGVLFVYVAGGEALLAVLPLHRSALWSPSNNLFAWLRDGVSVFDGSVVCTPGPAPCDQQTTISLLHGAAYLAVLLLVAVIASVASFRRRDIG